MLRVRFYDATTGITLFETFAATGSINFKLNETTEWSVSVLRSDVDVRRLEQGGVAADLIIDGVFVIGGKCQITPDQGKTVLQVKGRQWADTIYETSAWSQAVYKDMPLLVVLGELLRMADWRIGDITTLADKDQKTTIDLRQAEQLLAQVTTLLQGVPGLFMRYGGKVNGRHALDIGSFAQPSSIQLIQPPDADLQPPSGTGWILKPKREVDVTDVIYELEVLGGDVQVSASVTRAVNLGDALAINPALAADPNFPIVTVLPGYVWRIRNNAVSPSVGIRSLKRFTQYAPERAGAAATTADIQNAGLAAYNRGIAYLKDRSTFTEVLDLDVTGDLSILPRMGDLVYVRFEQSFGAINPITELPQEDRLAVEGFYRCTAVSLAVDGDKLNWSFSLSSGKPISYEDSFVSVYDAVSQDAPPAGAVYVPAFVPTMATISATATGGLPDAILADGSKGRAVTFTLPAAPGGATGVYLAGLPYVTTYSPNSPPTIELVSDPVFGGSGPVIAISINDTWEPSYSASLEARIVWI